MPQIRTAGIQQVTPHHPKPRRKIRVQVNTIATSVVSTSETKKEATQATPETETPPLPPKIQFERDMSFGDRGRDVRRLQTFLEIKPTGKFDANTHEAVRCWQRIHNLPQTGYFGKLSRAEAEKELHSKPASLIGALAEKNEKGDSEKKGLKPEAELKPATSAKKSEPPATLTTVPQGKLFTKISPPVVSPSAQAGSAGALAIGKWACIPLAFVILGVTVALTIRRKQNPAQQALLALVATRQRLADWLQLHLAFLSQGPRSLKSKVEQFFLLLLEKMYSLFFKISGPASKSTIAEPENVSQDPEISVPDLAAREPTQGSTRLQSLLEQRAAQQSEIRRQERLAELRRTYRDRREGGAAASGEFETRPVGRPSYVAPRPEPGILAKQIARVDEYYQRRTTKNVAPQPVKDAEGRLEGSTSGTPAATPPTDAGTSGTSSGDEIYGQALGRSKGFNSRDADSLKPRNAYQKPKWRVQRRDPETTEET
ncbi:hypothetical protein CYMTET_46084 [Cymbomonas tetramitiformis]|uniref:Peptidoglycan binding-like domain-containing protein n=1 Tax=Cymbomonas tetramitiformis TaxID=36881 RepID=A0AAE0EXY3_9CHLO|nr:hypothetical protein CYMTET_46084 [Cymbomonas tetramitiformis]